jgi:hypothetical protein
MKLNIKGLILLLITMGGLGWLWLGAKKNATTEEKNSIKPVAGNVVTSEKNQIATDDRKQEKEPPSLTSPDDMKAWAARDPRAALTWLVAQDEATFARYVEAAWEGAAAQPQVAVAMIREWVETNRQAVDLNGGFCVLALAKKGHAALALDLALTPQLPPLNAREWPSGILGYLAREGQPQPAIELWKKMPAGKPKEMAWRALVEAWADKEASVLCGYAVSLPENSLERTEALRAGGRVWKSQQPDEYSRWVTAQQIPEAVFQEPDPAIRHSAVETLSMIETVDNAKERLELTRNVITQWSSYAPDEAKKWITEATWLTELERSDLLQQIFARQSNEIREDHAVEPIVNNEEKTKTHNQ